MRSFWWKLGLYLAPVALYVAITWGIATWAGELTPLVDVARRQATSPLLYGRAYRDNYFAFKLISVRERRPELLVVGSSRTMQFRSGLANRRPEAFYNAGGASQSLAEMRRFVELAVSAVRPRVVILGLDQWWFNPKHSHGPAASRVAEQIDDETTVASARALNMGRFVVRDLVLGKIPPAALLVRRDPVSDVEAMGMNAIVNGNGFRTDGSWQYGALATRPASVEERLREGFARLRADRDHFSGADHVDRAVVDELEQLLEWSGRRGVFVFGVSPPYAPSVYARMAAGGRHGYLGEMAAALRAAFARHGFVYLDVTDGGALHARDDDMIDGFHASELIYLRIYRALVAAGADVLEPYSDAATLTRLASAVPAGRLDVFDRRARDVVSVPTSPADRVSTTSSDGTHVVSTDASGRPVGK